MRMPHRRLVVLAAIAGAAVSLLAPTAAHAAYYGGETNYAELSSGPTGTYYCTAITGANVCYKPAGDLLYVKDLREDGQSAVAEWLVMPDSGTTWRDGSCVNKLGAFHWGVCNKNFEEGWNMWLRAARYDAGYRTDNGANRQLPT
jgi:hypothetical protein